MMSAPSTCDELPIIVRATTQTVVPHATARVAQHNALATSLPVYVVVHLLPRRSKCVGGAVVSTLHYQK